MPREEREEALARVPSAGTPGAPAGAPPVGWQLALTLIVLADPHPGMLNAVSHAAVCCISTGHLAPADALLTPALQKLVCGAVKVLGWHCRHVARSGTCSSNCSRHSARACRCQRWEISVRSV